MHAEFTLPGGLVDAVGARHRRARLRPLNGFDEEWMHGLPGSTSRAAFVTELLRRCVARIGDRRLTRGVARELTVGDRDYLVLKLYEVTFGGKAALVLACPHAACGAKMDLDLVIAEIPVDVKPVEASYLLRVEAPEEAAEPESRAVEVEFRLPRGADQERIATSDARDPEQARDQLLEACVLRVGSSGDVARLLPAWSREALIRAIEDRAPSVEWEMEMICPECGHAFDAELDVVSLLLDEVKRGRASLDREIHLLAFHYHWSLRELYGLTRTRRRRFLRLLADELAARTS
jgi:hypothetical protein